MASLFGLPFDEVKKIFRLLADEAKKLGIHIVRVSPTSPPLCCVCDVKFLGRDYEEIALSIFEDDEKAFGYQAFITTSNIDKALESKGSKEIKEETISRPPKEKSTLKLLESLPITSIESKLIGTIIANELPQNRAIEIIKNISAESATFSMYMGWIEIILLCVDSSVLGKGVASLLMKYCIFESLVRGYNKAALHIANIERNPRAVGFYNKMGFIPIRSDLSLMVNFDIIAALLGV